MASRTKGPRLDDEHTLTYLMVTTKHMRKGPNKIQANEKNSKRELRDTLKMVATQHSESSKFAMQNHVGAKASGGWWSADASHDHQYETNSSDAKQTNDSERALTDAFGSMSLSESYDLKASDVYIETVAIKCHKFTVKGKESQTHCIHYPAQSASIVGPINRATVLSYAKMYFLDFESWRPVFAALSMHDDADDVALGRSELEKKLKAKVYQPGKRGILNAKTVRLTNAFAQNKWLAAHDNKKDVMMFDRDDGSLNWDVHALGDNKIKLSNKYFSGKYLAKHDNGKNVIGFPTDDGSLCWEVCSSPLGETHVRLKNNYRGGMLWLAAHDNRKDVIMFGRDDGSLDWKVEVLK